jgi:hypothetical protein
MRRRLPQLHAMDMQIAILNEAGQIVHVNQARRDCAEAQPGGRQLICGADV